MTQTRYDQTAIWVRAKSVTAKLTCSAKWSGTMGQNERWRRHSWASVTYHCTYLEGLRKHMYYQLSYYRIQIAAVVKPYPKPVGSCSFSEPVPFRSLLILTSRRRLSHVTCIFPVQSSLCAYMVYPMCVDLHTVSLLQSFFVVCFMTAPYLCTITQEMKEYCSVLYASI
jgi:hypothetical protein